MPERAVLTPELVDALEPPAVGERWIADLAQRGFGLRMWASEAGGGKAFVVRTTGIDGRQKRRTISLWELYRLAPWKLHRRIPTLGEFLEEARSWARDEIDVAKGRPTLATEELEQTIQMRSRVGGVTLRRFSEILLREMAAKGISQAYRDRLDKLFAHHIPSALQDKPATKITKREIVRALAAKQLSLGNRRLLRPFVGQILDLPASLGSRGKLTSYDIRRLDLPSARPERRRRGQTQQRFDVLFNFLEAQDEYWQQALCLRLFLEFRAPLSRLMAARWEELQDVRIRSRLRDDAPFWRREWRYAESLRGYETISNKSNGLITLLDERGRREFPESGFWFPSARNPTSHIRSVDYVWRLALSRLELPYRSPRDLRQEYHVSRPLHPWWDSTHDRSAYRPERI